MPVRNRFVSKLKYFSNSISMQNFSLNDPVYMLDVSEYFERYIVRNQTIVKYFVV